MKTTLKRFQAESRGDAIVPSLIGLLLFLILALIAVTIVQYSMIKSNMRTAANEVLQIMKVENGADANTEKRFKELLTKMQMDASLVSFTATPKQVQRGDVVEITTTREYEIFALKAVGVNRSVRITVYVSGLAHKYFREGG